MPSNDEICAKTRDLLQALETHPEFHRENPPMSNSCLFFLWDFVKKTCDEYVSNSANDEEKFQDVYSRDFMALKIIQDANMAMMLGRSPPPVWGDQVNQAAAALDQAMKH
ncbi:MAG: hypothetical protein M1834_006232 [Cirrosporium novae-zelandiae]|nr:MAG: hypothetical protein M1834_006232 [Cirrosporium novae-zelandiae]